MYSITFSLASFLSFALVRKSKREGVKYFCFLPLGGNKLIRYLVRVRKIARPHAPPYYLLAFTNLVNQMAFPE
jgi:hypothetical protein